MGKGEECDEPHGAALDSFSHLTKNLKVSMSYNKHILFSCPWAWPGQAGLQAYGWI